MMNVLKNIQVKDIIVGAVFLWLIYNLCMNKTEGYHDYPFGKLKSEEIQLGEKPNGKKPNGKKPNGKKVVEPEESKSLCGSQQNFLSTNLLPKGDANMDDMAEFAPQLDGKNFVDSYKYVLGSQSQSLRNSNYQLRSEPANPKMTVNNPWMNSTIDKDERRTKFE